MYHHNESVTSNHVVDLAANTRKMRSGMTVGWTDGLTVIVDRKVGVPDFVIPSKNKELTSKLNEVIAQFRKANINYVASMIYNLQGGT